MTRRGLLAVLLTAALVAFVVVPVTMRLTAAAWQDDVHVSAPVSAGEWVAPPLVPPESIEPGDGADLDVPEWHITSTTGFCVDLAVTGTAATFAPWSLLIHLDEAPFRGGTTAGQIYYQGPTQVAVAAVPGEPTLARVTGVGNAVNPWNASYNNVLLDTAHTLDIRLCGSSTGVPPVADPLWYTVTTAHGTWTPTRACIVVTATANTTSDNPFYLGWQTVLDLTAAKARITSTGHTLNYVSWSPDPSGGYQFTISPTAGSPVPDSYTITSGRMTSIKHDVAAHITACVNGY